MEVGFIGTGNMGTAIIAGLSKNYKKEDINVFDIDKEKSNKISKYAVSIYVIVLVI